jgi:hypothetical protein
VLDQPVTGSAVIPPAYGVPANNGYGSGYSNTPGYGNYYGN